MMNENNVYGSGHVGCEGE